MFWSRPWGSDPDVTGPYCSQTRSGALPPEAWLSTDAFDWVMLALLLGSHTTVTFLWAASYWSVRCFRPALSDAEIGPVLGGSTALMVTAAPLEPFDELLDEHPAARPPASNRAVPSASGVLRGILRTVPHLLMGIS